MAALVLAVLVGVFAYQAGVANGLAQSGKVTTMVVYPGFFFAPFLLFFLFAFALRGAWHHRRRCEWHKQAHETMS
jgi:hypothetical protein